MRILVTGGGGMIGQKFVRQLVKEQIPTSELILHDLQEPRLPVDADFPIRLVNGDISSKSESERLAELEADVIVHLAAIVSGEAEADFDKGWSINAGGSWNLLEAVRQQGLKRGQGYRPKFIFASSVAAFGGPYPEVIEDDFLCAPTTSYGAQKVMTEMLVSDYSRKGFVDGLAIRFPTICIRPGKANKAASSFFSAIIREPLNGVEALLPVGRDVRHWAASPRSAARYLTHALTLDFSKLGTRRGLNMPGVSVTVGEMIEALERIAGKDVVSLINEEHDETIVSITGNWPQRFDPVRATALGFQAETNFDDIIQVYLEDDFTGSFDPAIQSKETRPYS